MVRRRRGGFTLIELLVASAIALLVLTAATSFLVHVAGAHRRQVELTAVRGASALVLSTLSTELRQAGLGVPGGFRREAPKDPFAGRIVLAENDRLGFVADLPRPDSTFNGVSALADDQTVAGAIALLNEQNGDCDVDLNATPHCTTDAQSTLFPPEPGLDCAADPLARTCPWGLNRYRADEYVIIADARGGWVERQVDPLLVESTATRRALKLAGGALPAMPTVPNAGYLSTPDRVFFQLNGTTIERNQCWGSLGSPVTLAALATPCASGADGTGFQALATGAANPGLVFRYLDSAGASLVVLPATAVAAADLPRIRTVEVSLHLERSFGGNTVTLDDATRVAFRQ